MNGKYKYLISVIICTYNNLPLLKFSVEAILKQNLDNNKYEVLIIDNNSNDGTNDYIRDILPLYSNLKYFKESSQGLSYARNRGINESNANIITFIDDDAIAEKNLLEVVLNKFKTYPSIVCLGGKVVPKIDFDVQDWFLKKYQNYLVLGYDAGNEDLFLDKIHGPVGANISFKRKVFDHYGKFDLNLGRKKDTYLANEEELLLRKIKSVKGSCLYAPVAIVHHIAKRTRVGRKYLLHRAYYKGISDARSGYKKKDILHGLGKPFILKIIDEIYEFKKRLYRFIKAIYYRYSDNHTQNYLNFKPSDFFEKMTSNKYNRDKCIKNVFAEKFSVILKNELINCREKLFSAIYMSGTYNIGYYLEKIKLAYFK